MKRYLQTNIEFFDLFELMGVTSFADQEKVKIIQELFSIGLEKFLYDQLGEIEDTKVIMRLRQLATQQAGFDAYISVLEKYNPNLKRQLTTSIRETKKKYLLNYFDQMIIEGLKRKELVESKGLTSDKLKGLEDTLQKYKQAEKLAMNDQWRELIKFWKT